MIHVVSVLPVVLVGFTQWLVPAIVPPTIPFGVRVPFDRAEAPVVLAARRLYRVVTAVVTVAAAVFALVAPWAGPVAVGAELLTGLALYLGARRRIAEAKTAERWYGGRRQVTVADTSLRTDPERYPWPWALPAVLLTAATVVTGIAAYPHLPSRLPTHFGLSGRVDRFAAKSVASVFAPVLMQVAATVLLVAVAGAVLHSRAWLDVEDPAASVRHRRFVAAVSRVLLVLAGCTSATFLFGALAAWDVVSPPAPVRSALGFAPGLVGVAVVLLVAVRVGQGGSRLHVTGGGRTGRGARTVNRDDDALYRWGVFYFNRDDPSVLVPKRFGFGWTLNMARPATWLIIAAIVGSLVLGEVVHSLG
ncbi:DUF1648 domain-containing protein [Actinomadura sp. DC4]|uniref:DUF1648 domain-containing protein n=1 Tax=Actinomadura sp. DC4 TaxID=3055069 RepID=UPI0025B01314|nr:DUF1648 domain-containing protein [Actinomadura sp. DC4]MDN3352315.1 DUF1648 domain-containing protein [Actinomadura sp. DC4]